jgi:hypothetical protein
LVHRLERARGTIRLSLESTDVIHASAREITDRLKAAAKPPAEEHRDAIVNARTVDAIRFEVTVADLCRYRELSDPDLTRVVALWESSPGQFLARRYHEGLLAALGAARDTVVATLERRRTASR